MHITPGHKPRRSPAQVTNRRRPERMQDTRKRAVFYCSKYFIFATPEELTKTAVSNIILSVRCRNHATIFYLHAGKL